MTIKHGTTTSAGMTPAEVARLREDFPTLRRSVRGGHDLVYLDSGATAQKPQRVIDAELDFYTRLNAAPHRGAHLLAEEATEAYEGARQAIARFIGARHRDVIFTRSGTEALNMVAYAFSNATAPGAMDGVAPEMAERFQVGPGDEIVVTQVEHHANLVPWQELARRTGATLTWVDVDDEGMLLDPTSAISERAKVVAFTHLSNVTGELVDPAPFVARAREVGALTVLDACQSVPHVPVDVDQLGVDLMAFTGHKVLGPSGVGILWGRSEVLNAMPPMSTGGSMIEIVRMESSTYAPPPTRFEPGVPATAQAVGLGVAVDYMAGIGMENVAAHDQALVRHALEGFAQRPWASVVGSLDPARRVGCVSFTVEGVHPHDVGQILDDSGVAVRTGHHCAWPLHRRLRIPATTRASFAAYTTTEEIDAFFTALDRVPGVFGVEV